MTSAVALSFAGVLVAVAPLGVDSEPPGTDPASDATAAESSDATAAPSETDPQVELEGNPDFQRKLAELAFALYLGNELDVEAGSYACTEPTTLDIGAAITCFTLIGEQRVIVAETELSATAGVYEFELVSDHEVEAADATTTTAPPPETSGPTTTSFPTPFLVTTVAPLTPADSDILARGEQINQDAQGVVDNLIAGDEDLIEGAAYSWDDATATVTLSVTFSPSYTYPLDTAAWILARDRALDLWRSDSPFRAAGASIRPGLVVVVNGNRYVSDFDLCVRIADQTIGMDEWITASRSS